MYACAVRSNYREHLPRHRQATFQVAFRVRAPLRNRRDFQRWVDDGATTGSVSPRFSGQSKKKACNDVPIRLADRPAPPDANRVSNMSSTSASQTAALYCCPETGPAWSPGEERISSGTDGRTVTACLLRSSSHAPSQNSWARRSHYLKRRRCPQASRVFTTVDAASTIVTRATARRCNGIPMPGRGRYLDRHFGLVGVHLNFRGD